MNCISVPRGLKGREIPRSLLQTWPHSRPRSNFFLYIYFNSDMMAFTLPTHLKFKPPNLQHQILPEIVTARVTSRSTARGQHASSLSIHRHIFIPKFRSIRPLLTRACGDPTPQHSTTTSSSSVSSTSLSTFSTLHSFHFISTYVCT